MWAQVEEEQMPAPTTPFPPEAPDSVNKQMEATAIRKTASKKYAAKPFLILSFLDCF